MTKLTRSFVLIAFLHAVAANASTYTVRVKFDTSPGNPVRLFTVDKFCILSVADIIFIYKGVVEFQIVTNSHAYERCGWEHSSATFQAQDSDGKGLMEFEFYKPLAKSSYLFIKTSGVDCTVSALSLSCKNLAPPSPARP